ncbi:MAG: hypothetical protein DRN30_06015, partial [Thermoplasmata archaeon]
MNAIKLIGKGLLTILILATIVGGYLACLHIIIAQSDVIDTPIVILDNNYNLPFVKGGSGTEESPYIIENIVVNVKGEPALMIENSNKYLIIRNVTFIAENYRAVIQLYNVSHLTLENVRIIGEKSDYGIALDNVTHSNFINVSIRGTLAPLSVKRPKEFENTFKHLKFYERNVIIVSNEKDIKISGTYAQVILYNVTNVVIDKAMIASENVKFINFGVLAYYAEKLLIEDTTIKAANAIFVYNSKNITVRNSTIIFTNYGTSFENSSEIIVSNVKFIASIKNLAVRIYKSSDALIENLELSSTGISVSNSKDVTLRDIKIKGNMITIIESNNVILSNVEIKDCKSTALEISSSMNVYIKKLVVKNIRFIYGTDIQKEERVNAFVMRFIKGITISSSIIQNVYTGLMIVSGQDIVINNTTIYDAVIGLDGYYIHNFTFVSNYIGKVASVGLKLMYSDNIEITRSTFSSIQATGIEFFSVESARVEYSAFENVGNYVVEDSQHEYLHNYWDKYTGVDLNGDGYGDQKFNVSAYSYDPAPT